jgi:hypothetical protein
MLLRRLLLVSLLLLGAAFLVCGSAYHRVTVLEAREREITIVVPSPLGFGDQGFGPADLPQDSESSEDSESNGEAAEDGNPFEPRPANEAGQQENPFAPRMNPGTEENPFEARGGPAGGLPELPPGLQTKRESEQYTVALQLSEWALVFDATVGGLTRVNGELRRTYSGQPPALCPT